MGALCDGVRRNRGRVDLAVLVVQVDGIFAGVACVFSLWGDRADRNKRPVFHNVAHPAVFYADRAHQPSSRQHRGNFRRQRVGIEPFGNPLASVP